MARIDYFTPSTEISLLDGDNESRYCSVKKDLLNNKVFLQRYQWTEEEVLARLETKLETAYDKVVSYAEQKDIPLRVAALAIGISEVASTKSIRGLFP